MILPAVLSYLSLGAGSAFLIGASRWVVLVALTMFGLAAIFRYGPSRTSARWRWITPGVVMACLLWILASAAFTVYVGHFGTYNESFGAIAGVVVLILWLWISSFVILIGAELDAEIEAQTRRDTTTGPPKPMGRRGAYKADTLGALRPGGDK